MLVLGEGIVHDGLETVSRFRSEIEVGLSLMHESIGLGDCLMLIREKEFVEHAG